LFEIHLPVRLSHPRIVLGLLACKPGSVRGGDFSGASLTRSLKRSTRRVGGARHPLPIWPCFLWGLPSRALTRTLVRSYRTVSPLPQKGGLRFCGTFRRPNGRLGVTQHSLLW